MLKVFFQVVSLKERSALLPDCFENVFGTIEKLLIENIVVNRGESFGE
jgi:hypothetical protein